MASSHTFVMELTSLTVLVDILDAGNLSQAARNLKMTRANVSYHLHQLEKSVGVQMVRRTTRRVEPTEVGLRLYAHGRAIQNEMLAARASAAGWLDFGEVTRWLHRRPRGVSDTSKAVTTLACLAPELLGYHLMFWELICRTSRHD